MAAEPAHYRLVRSLQDRWANAFLRMRADVEIPYLSHLELLGSTGGFGVMEPITEELMRERNEAEWRGDEHDSPHEQPWFTSFHASQFPGDDPDACERYLVYRMMNIPPAEPMPPWVTTTATQGKAGELDIVKSWYHGRRCLAIPEGMPGGEHQLGFEDPEVWLSGSVDLPILKPFWVKPHIVEIKGKADEVLNDMREGRRRWDAAHRQQVLTSLGLANKYDWGRVTVCQETWRILSADVMSEWPLALDSCPDHGPECAYTFVLERPDTASLYYWSRSWPRGKPGSVLGQPVEYFFVHDEKFFQAGRAVLARARQAFLDRQLPERRDGFMWGLGACQYCSFKRECCRPDEGRKKDPTVTRLADSNALKFAKSIRPDYSFELVYDRVLERWPDA